MKLDKKSASMYVPNVVATAPAAKADSLLPASEAKVDLNRLKPLKRLREARLNNMVDCWMISDR